MDTCILWQFLWAETGTLKSGIGNTILILNYPLWGRAIEWETHCLFLRNTIEEVCWKFNIWSVSYNSPHLIFHEPRQNKLRKITLYKRGGAFQIETLASLLINFFPSSILLRGLEVTETPRGNWPTCLHYLIGWLLMSYRPEGHLEYQVINL